MRRGGQGKKRDANEMPIIRALQAVGATVAQLSGADLPDLVVGYCGGNWLLEVKTEKGKLSAGQAIKFAQWQGNVTVVRTPEQALRRIGVKATRRA